MRNLKKKSNCKKIIGKNLNKIRLIIENAGTFVLNWKQEINFLLQKLETLEASKIQKNWSIAKMWFKKNLNSTCHRKLEKLISWTFRCYFRGIWNFSWKIKITKIQSVLTKPNPDFFLGFGTRMGCIVVEHFRTQESTIEEGRCDGVSCGLETFPHDIAGPGVHSSHLERAFEQGVPHQIEHDLRNPYVVSSPTVNHAVQSLQKIRKSWKNHWFRNNKKITLLKTRKSKQTLRKKRSWNRDSLEKPKIWKILQISLIFCL